MCEINRLKNELREMKNYRCQTDIAKKILNVGDFQYVVSIIV